MGEAQEGFVQVLAMAQELEWVKVGQITVAVDGTKVLANASKHRAVSCERAGQETVEPVFGIIQSVMGFRRFLVRRLEKVSVEWTWVSLAYKLKRMHRMQWAGSKPSRSAQPGFGRPVASTN
jgi:hypothetical protein